MDMRHLETQQLNSSVTERQVQETKSISLPAIFLQGLEDGVTPPAMSRNLN
jgi:hypothetical protein